MRARLGSIFALEQLRVQVGVDGRLFPRGVPQIAQHLSGLRQLVAEKCAPGKAGFCFPAEFPLFLKLVKRFDLTILLNNELHHFGENVVVVGFWIIRPYHARGAQVALQISHNEYSRPMEIAPIYPGMKCLVCCITARIAVNPAVEIARRVEWLSGIADEMAQRTHEK